MVELRPLGASHECSSGTAHSAGSFPTSDGVTQNNALGALASSDDSVASIGDGTPATHPTLRCSCCQVWVNFESRAWSCRRCGNGECIRFCERCAHVALILDRSRTEVGEPRHEHCIGCSRNPREFRNHMGSSDSTTSSSDLYGWTFEYRNR